MRNILFIILFTFSGHCFSQQLVYTAKNPNFGGDPYNHTWLLNAANAQNSFKDPDSSLKGLDLSRFNQSLNSQFINQQFGGQVPPLGISSSGNFEYDVFDSTQGLVINILNTQTGEQTQIIIPN